MVRVLAHATFYSLSVFAAVVEAGSFNQAAERLHLTQPAVSMQVQRLESLLGVCLLCRQRGRYVGLTAEGQVLYQCARDVIGRVAAADDLLSGMKKGSSGRLRVGVNTTLGNYALMKVLTAFRSQNPTAEVSVFIGQQTQVSGALAAGDVDVAYLADWGLAWDLPMNVIGMEPMVVVAAPHHPMAKEQAVSLADLAPFPLLTGLRGSGHWRWVTRHLRESGLLPRFSLVELGDADAVKAGLRDGNGVGFLLNCAVAAELAAKRLALIPVTGGPFQIPVAVSHPVGKANSPLLDQFLQVLREIEVKRMRRERATLRRKLQATRT